jgi:hypothetical protein
MFPLKPILKFNPYYEILRCESGGIFKMRWEIRVNDLSPSDLAYCKTQFGQVMSKCGPFILDQSNKPK